MHLRRTLLIPMIATLGLAPISRADDKETIEKLQKENVELRKQLDRAQEAAKAADEFAAKSREEFLKLAAIIEKQTQTARKQSEEFDKLLKAHAARQQELIQQLVELDKKASGLADNHAATLKELGVLKEERKALVKQADAERAAVLKIAKDLFDEKRRATESRTETEDYKQKAVQLEVELQLHRKRSIELERRLVELEKANGANNKAPVEKRLADSVRGQIQRVAGDNLMVLSIGSDAGLVVGHTLDVYRIGKGPKDAKYLGKATIIKVEPKQSAAKFSGVDRNSVPAEGDQVTSGNAGVR